MVAKGLEPCLLPSSCPREGIRRELAGRRTVHRVHCWLPGLSFRPSGTNKGSIGKPGDNMYC